MKSPPIADARTPDHVAQISAEDLEARLAEAHAAGYEAGLVDAEAALADAIATLAAALDRAGERLDRSVGELVALDAGAVVELGAALAEWFLGARVLEDPDTIVHAIERVLQEHADHDPLEIHVAPELVDHLTRRFATTVQRVRADATLGPVDFVVRTAGPTIAARWSDAVEHARLALLDSTP
ncbi:MAG: hypothetical protein KC910_26620 [Candidatus Eremiobacteraeota bacterium]|nr:hypothetical protein [Candidatus Eremiobacteraeota bacterium]